MAEYWELQVQNVTCITQLSVYRCIQILRTNWPVFLWIYLSARLWMTVSVQNVLHLRRFAVCIVALYSSIFSTVMAEYWLFTRILVARFSVYRGSIHKLTCLVPPLTIHCQRKRACTCSFTVCLLQPCLYTISTSRRSQSGGPRTLFRGSRSGLFLTQDLLTIWRALQRQEAETLGWSHTWSHLLRVLIR